MTTGWVGVDRKRLKLLLTIGAVCVATSVAFVATNANASGYEITVYDSYPGTFWLLLVVAVLIGQIVIFESGQLDDNRSYWRWGFALLLSTYLVLLMIQALRYNMYARGDMLTLIGMVLEIKELNVIPESNYYPNVHLLSLTVSYATGLRVAKVINVITPLMSIFYFVSVYALLDTVFTDKRKLPFALPFASLLLFKGQHVTFQPSWFAFCTIPFILFLFFRGYRRTSRYPFKVALVLTIVALAFYHPAVTFFFIAMLIALKGASLVGRQFARRSLTTGSTPLLAASIALILFFSWYYSFETFAGSTVTILYLLLGLSEGASQFGNLSGTIARTNPQLLDLALAGIYTYGLYAAVVGLGLVFLGYLTYLALRRRRSYDPIEAFLGVTFLVFTVGAAIAFFIDVVLAFHRILRYAIFSGSILIGIGFYTLFQRIDAESVDRYLRPIIYVSFFVFAFLSVFTLYGSPLSDDNNRQITQAEIEGMEWLFTHRNTSLVIDQLGINQYRLYTYTQSKKGLGTNVRWHLPPPPMNFMYSNASLEDIPDSAAVNRRYLVITELGRTKNPRFYPQYRQFWRHTPEDFRRLEHDPSFHHVYDDGTLDSYIVRNVSTQPNGSRSAMRAGSPIIETGPNGQALEPSGSPIVRVAHSTNGTRF